MVLRPNNKQVKSLKSSQSSKNAYIFAVGRRKEAVARVRLYDVVNKKIELFGEEYQKGDVIVNGKPFATYFRFAAYSPLFKDFFETTGVRDKFVYSIKVEGGGIRGQLDAAILGMARTLDKLDSKTYRPLLKSKKYLTRDARIRERRKVGMGGKARRKKQSPKR